ncbi:MAG TPA: V-type ATP synthase subunit F, partial [Candidatus Hydrogenedentes bacterium]|nr:V-type ATP synthase subunit F [Candidatus Hydrogenedentota bacterium]
MLRAVAVGEKRFILGFKGAGFEIVECNDAVTLRAELNRLSRETDIALAIVTESIAAEAPDALDAFRGRSDTILTVIPTHEGSMHTSFERRGSAAAWLPAVS